MKRLCYILLLCTLPLVVQAQRIPVSTEYSLLYDFLDELANEKIIHVNSAIKPYTRDQVATLLEEASANEDKLNKRQKADLQFYLNSFSLERNTMPDNWVEWTDRQTFNLSLAEPAFHALVPYKQDRDEKEKKEKKREKAPAGIYSNQLTPENEVQQPAAFKMSIKPILGMDIYASKKGAIIKRWYGAELNMDIVNHLSIWGSLRDNSWNGEQLKDSYYPSKAYYNPYSKQGGAKLTRPTYLNNIPGVQYKEATYGGDFSDSRGGISLYSWWGSIGVQRENIAWGDAYHASNILSGHNPAVPMITLNLKPCRWFEFNYFHAWLNSNIVDSTYFYTENYKEGETKIHYRPAPKYMAANMFTFSPIRQLSFSFGNSIVYAERTPQAAYFIPIAFYKSLDHLLTKGMNIENQNSQLFFTINTRNLRHTNFYASFFIDEFNFSRLKKGNEARNPFSYLVGAKVSNWPVHNLALTFEFMRQNIACGVHSVAVTDYTSNSYNMGHYMADNSQNVFLELSYKPVRGLWLALSYTNDTKYNKYDYVRANIIEIISQKPFAEKTYMNNTLSFDAKYEIFSGCYAVINCSYNNAQGFAPYSDRIAGEDRGQYNAVVPRELKGDAWNDYQTGLSQYYLDMFCPVYLQGKNFTFMCGLSFNF